MQERRNTIANALELHLSCTSPSNWWSPVQHKDVLSVAHSPVWWLHILMVIYLHNSTTLHNEVIKWKHFRQYWPFVQEILQSPVNSPHKGQWCLTLMFSLICTSINSWVNNCEAGDLRHCRADYDIILMNDEIISSHWISPPCLNFMVGLKLKVLSVNDMK